MSEVKLYLGDCLEVMKSIPDKSVDAVITDPPYELGFMGKKWDGTGIAYSVEMWREVLRVLKPGGHLLAFGGTRTYHRMACAIEDAGFEIRDQIQWLYGSGFPKSYNISKGIDKQAGKEPVVIGKRTDGRYAYHFQDGNNQFVNAENNSRKEVDSKIGLITAPSTPEAQLWDGWGSALKPANEPICLARKPLSEKTIVENVLKWGTGGINVDGCRVGDNGGTTKGNPPKDKSNGINGDGINGVCDIVQLNKGRFPSNLILDEEAAELLDEQSGESKSGVAVRHNSGGNTFGGDNKKPAMSDMSYNDKGGASRFFYCAKASRSERNAGLDGMEEKIKAQSGGAQGAESRGDDEYKQDSIGLNRITKVQNFHPTVKPVSLMRYLCRLITPPNGVVLDPFMGSGTTGCAAALEGFDFVGIEQDAEYIEIAKRRIDYWQSQIAIELQPTLI